MKTSNTSNVFKICVGEIAPKKANALKKHSTGHRPVDNIGRYT
ncbi:MAG: hypothetical protein PHI32_07020 [Dysgonamonadaceae bacterium]|nr:hypothetical protein [Dysgonamonadaceae bacterium]